MNFDPCQLVSAFLLLLVDTALTCYLDIYLNTTAYTMFQSHAVTFNHSFLTNKELKEFFKQTHSNDMQ